MNPQAGGVATGEAEETAPTQEQSLSDEILALMKGEEPVAQQKEEVPPEVEPPQETELPETEQSEEEEQEEDQVQPAAGQKWPSSASKRVAEETDKRRRATARADKAEAERDHYISVAQQLDAQLREANLPRPNQKDPLADVFDLQGLAKAARQYQTIKDVATSALDENPNQDEIEIVVGKNKNGEPVTESFSRSKLSEMKRNAEHALSNLIPQRRDVLVARNQMDALAAQVYPQFAENKGDNEWAGFVRQTLAQYPELAKVPDIAVWLGHTLLGRQITLERLQNEIDKNGSRSAEGLSSEAKKILSAPKLKSAPPISTRRVPSQTMPRRGADVEAARKTMKARPGDDDALEAFIDAKLFRGASRGYEKVS
jgi:hypothetical protein